MKTLFSKILIVLALVFALIPITFADPPEAPLESVPEPPTAGSPSSPNVSVPAVPGGIPSAPNPVGEVPGGLPVAPEGSVPDVPNADLRTLPNPPSQQIAPGTFLQIATPNSHGLPGEEGVEPMISRVINNALGFIALLGIFAIIIAALQLWLAQGKADAIGKAKTNIFNIVIGFVVVMLAWSGVAVALKFLGF